MKTRQFKITLLSFQGCPNADEARENLKEALAVSSLPVQWEEVDLESKDCPQPWRGFPSPTVLIDGQDLLTGKMDMAGATACRMGGAPKVEQIVSKLKSAMGA